MGEQASTALNDRVCSVCWGLNTLILIYTSICTNIATEQRVQKLALVFLQQLRLSQRFQTWNYLLFLGNLPY